MYVTIIGGTHHFHGKFINFMLSDHFWGVNSDFCANFINQNSFCDIRENTPKSYGMGLSPPPHTENVRSFVTFFALMASLTKLLAFMYLYFLLVRGDYFLRQP